MHGLPPITAGLNVMRVKFFIAYQHTRQLFGAQAFVVFGLQPRRFKQFAISSTDLSAEALPAMAGSAKADGVLQWNDFDLIFPMADLYDGAIR
jgi:hypothetical protein